MQFAGSDITHADHSRLQTQLAWVKHVALNNWRSLEQISEAVEGLSGKPCRTASVSAQLRNLKKRDGGNHVLEKRRVGPGQYLYRVSEPAAAVQRELFGVT